MSAMLDAMTPPPLDKPAIAAIFVLTYLGIAAGHVPGLKLDRTGIGGSLIDTVCV